MKRQPKSGYVIVGKHLRDFLKLAIKTAEPGGMEICGVIVSNGYCLDLVLTRNKSKHPGSFLLPSGQIRKIRRAARRLNHRIVGTFHSHPFSEVDPGESDIRGARAGDLMLILSCCDREAKLWRISKGTSKLVALQCVEL
jgi:proteasome lid subunit RPN8/RPN11